MSSGVTVASNCLDMYQELKIKKKHKYIIFKLNDNTTEIIVDKSSPSTDYDEFLKNLPENQCRWAVYDLEFQTEDGQRNKIVFLQWSPDDARIKDKMVTASSREPLRRSFTGIAVDIQGTDHSEVAYETVLEKANRIK